MTRPVFLLVACLACGGKGKQPPATPVAAPAAPTDTTVQGIIAVTGADPFSQVVVKPSGTGMRDVAVVGALRSELGALAGAQVRVRGRAVNNGQPVPPRAVEATGYEIVAIAGAKPVVGTLVARDDALWVDGQRLAGVPAELRQAVGAKVWVVGRGANGELLVLGYGIIVRPRR